MAMKSSPAGDFGEAGEELLRAWLKGQGYYFVPASLIHCGGAPALEGHLRKFVLPDILAARDGVSAWVEVKTKARGTWNQKRQRWETGCALRHWRDYVAVQIATGIPGALAFVHTQEARLYFGRFNDIGPTAAVWDEVRPNHAFTEPMIFFDLGCFTWYGLAGETLLQKLQDAALPPETVRPWEQKRRPPECRQPGLFEGM
jgi:hypothetical protein